jgi:hypothetical protein
VTFGKVCALAVIISCFVIVSFIAGVQAGVEYELKVICKRHLFVLCGILVMAVVFLCLMAWAS